MGAVCVCKMYFEKKKGWWPKKRFYVTFPYACTTQENA